MTEMCRLSESAELALGVQVLSAGEATEQALPFWLEPLLRTRSGERIGRSLLPGPAPDDRPIVRCGPGALVTTASKASLCLPFLVYRQRLRRVPPATSDGWGKLHEKWSGVAAEAERLERALGGDGGMSALLALSDQWKEWQGDGLSREQQTDIDHRILARLDASPAFQRYVEWIRTLEGREAAPPPEGLGCWSRAASAWWSTRIEESGSSSGWREAWAVVRDAHGVDDSALTPFRVFMNPDASYSMRVLRKAARRLLDAADGGADIPAEVKRDPRYAAALRSAADGYDGREHARAAALLDEAGQPEASLLALISTDFWARLRGVTLEPVREAALGLAERNGWRDLARHLQRLRRSSEGSSGAR